MARATQTRRHKGSTKKRQISSLRDFFVSSCLRGSEFPSMNSFFSKPSFRIQRRFASHAGGSDGLFIGGVSDIPSSENTFDTGRCPERIFQHDESLCVGF